MTRTDIHRPSAIIPEDYTDVGFLPHVDVGNWEFVAAERKRINEHMKRTGGHWEHPSAGSCAICGNVMAMSHVIFHHTPTNAYLRVGMTCADKLDFSRGAEFNEFRTHLKAAIERKAGKAKAKALLAEWGMDAAWTVYELPNEKRGSFAVETIVDIISKLIQYGSISDPQKAFINKLLVQIDNHEVVTAQRKAEIAAAASAPVTDERIRIEGEIITIKEQETDFGLTTKLLIKTPAGWKAWGTCPSALNDDELAKGQHVGFMARFQRSNDDPKFGFFSRPTKAEFLEVTS